MSTMIPINSYGLTRQEYKAMLQQSEDLVLMDDVFMLKSQTPEFEDDSLIGEITNDEISLDSCADVTFINPDDAFLCDITTKTDVGKIVFTSKYYPTYKWIPDENHCGTELTHGCASCVDMNGNVHIVHGNNYYKINASSGDMTTESTEIPFYCHNGVNSLFYDDDGLHILGCDDTLGKFKGRSHLVFDGTSWLYAMPSPIKTAWATCVVNPTNGEVHIIGGKASDAMLSHYKYANHQWVKLGNLPVASGKCTLIYYDNKLHMMGGFNPQTSIYNETHYVLNGESWRRLNDLPDNEVYRNCGVIVHNGQLHIVGRETYPHSSGIHMIWNNESDVWKKYPPVKAHCPDGIVFHYNDNLCVIGYDFYNNQYAYYVPAELDLSCNILIVNS